MFIFFDCVKQAMLRMPQSMNDYDRRVIVKKTIATLSLNRCAKTIISRLSGGERKRLSFASALLIDPHVLLLDEPTSGLDSYLARALMHKIRKMADEMRRTVVVVLHQPTSDMFALLDSLCLIVHGGRQAFFGDIKEAPVFFSTECGLSAPSLDNYMEQLAAPLTGDETKNRGNMVADRYTISKYAEALDHDISTISDQETSDTPAHSRKRYNAESFGRPGFFRQLKWLLWRTWLERRRDPLRTTNLIGRLVFMSVILGIIFFRLRPTTDVYEQNLNAISYCHVFLNRRV